MELTFLSADVKVKVILRPTFSQPDTHLELITKFVFLSEQLQGCWCGAPSLTRGGVCSLHLLLYLASAVFLGSASHGTHELLSQIWDSPNLEGKVPVFISVRNKGAQLYLHALVKNVYLIGWRQIQSQSHVTTDGQSVSMSWYWAPSGSRNQMFITVWRLLLCLCGEPSLTRGWFCRLSESALFSRLSVHI
jgi:hypothetical protein